MTATAQQLQALRHDFLLKGWTRKATGRILFELLVHLLLAAAGIAAFLAFDSIVLRACGLMLLAGGSMGAGTNAHTSSHYATSDKKWLNELLTYFGFPFILGLSATYWWHQHIVVHHPTPNVIGVDDDADLAPWFARTRDEMDQTSGFRRFYYERLQWLVLPFMLLFNGPNMQKSGSEDVV